MYKGMSTVTHTLSFILLHLLLYNFVLVHFPFLLHIHIFVIIVHTL